MMILLSFTEKEESMVSRAHCCKKILINRWNPPHTLSRQQWVLLFLDIISMALSTARIHGAKEKTIETWKQAFADVKLLVQPVH